MSYQIPSKAKFQFLLAEGKFPMYTLAPTGVSKLTNVVVSMYIKGHMASDFKMRVNFYKDRKGNTLLAQSTPVNIQSIQRNGDYYCELRFDFPVNSPAIGTKHLLEFEIYDGYVYDANNFVSLHIDYQEALAYLGSDTLHLENVGKLGHKISVFMDLVEDQNDEKYYMVKMQGSKLLNMLGQVQELDPGINYYEFTIQKGLWLDPLDTQKCVIYDNGTEHNISRSLDYIAPNPLDYSENINKFFYEPETGFFQLYTNYQLGVDTGINTGVVGILKYYLFFTECRGRYAAPYMTDFPSVVYWQPRLLPGLEFGFDQGNTLNGLLSITTSNIALKNEDRYMNQFFSPNDSFGNRQVTIWRCKGSVMNSTLEAVATIRAANLSDETCSIDLEDILSALDKSYEDELALAFENLGYTTNAIHVDDRQKIVPRLFGRRGPYGTYQMDTGQDLGGGYNNRIPALDGSKMTRFVNVSRNDTFATNVNRTWSLGFGPSSVTDKVFDCTLHTQLILGAFQASILTIDTSTFGNDGRGANNFFAPGDSIRNGGQYGIVYEVTATNLYIWPYNPAFSNANSVERKKIPSVVIKKGDDIYYPVSFRDYNVSLGSGGDVRIVFVNNFEANLPGLGTLDPDACEIYGRMYNDSDPGTLTTVLETIVNRTGIIEASATFAPDQQPFAPNAYNDQSYPDPFVSFTLPFVNDERFPTFREIIERLLKTGFGFLYFDDSGYARYKSWLDGIHEDGDSIEYIDNQSGISPIAGEISEKNSSNYGVRFDLYDMYAGVRFNFTHNPDAGNLDYGVYGINGVGMKGVQKFYNTNKVYEVESLMDVRASYSTHNQEEYVKLVCGRRAIHSFTAFTSDRVYLGDDLLVSRARIVGESNSAFMRVISLSKGVNEQKLELVDLKRFPGL